jgi:hypothetical protein
LIKQIALVVAIALLSLDAHTADNADLTAVTPDGRSVILKSDNTWEFFTPEPGDPATSAVLTVTAVREMGQACEVSFRLDNNFGSKIVSLVPRLEIYNKDGILYDNPSISFATIKPTKHERTKIQFSGIGCHEISVLKVSDAKHCRMGDIDMWNEEEGECLGHLYVVPSDLINITK